MPALTDMEDVRAALTQIARGIENFLLAPENPRASTASSSPRDRGFPELVNAFIESGPMPFRKMLAAFFEAANQRGALKVPNPSLAAHQLGLAGARPAHLERMLNLKQPLWDELSVDEVVTGAVDMIMKGYAPDPK